MNERTIPGARCGFCGVGEKYIRVGRRENSEKYRAYCWNCAASTVELATEEEAVREWELEGYTIPTHGERRILEGCIALMKELTGELEEYLEYMGVKLESVEDRFITSMTYRHIVNRLFLWHTHHSGGTSTAAKCHELGIEDSSNTVVFGIDPEEDEDEEED